jgi:hypothetical protein
MALISQPVTDHNPEKQAAAKGHLHTTQFCLPDAAKISTFMGISLNT